PKWAALTSPMTVVSDADPRAPTPLAVSAIAASGAEQLAAVDGDGLAGHPAGQRRGKEQRDVGDLLGPAEAAERDALEDPVIENRIAGLAGVPDAARKLDRARGDAVGADALAGEQPGLRAGVVDRGRLGGAV